MPVISFEALSLAASVGTFLVIAATAIAAMVQLRHMRSSNQVAALSKLEEMWDEPEFRKARKRVSEELEGRFADPAFQAELTADVSNDELVSCTNAVFNFYETMGVYVKHGLADAEVVCDFWSAIIVKTWRRFIARVRGGGGGDVIWENFEYMVVVAQRYIDKHPHGSFPPGLPRLSLEETDRRD